ncbi:ubiquitin carboxyl-terminal hydrolase 14 [Diaporthe amygdali]|uniref:ubiquitin carboxyl-terminal hydrolase 14 n=1 Tax=Phomopsis amygdali TaxID=1214568 RepID=UPI0022FE12CB|nr:ubiquitin carboxyl-terminal hydrolase 14 [Diaporthe amygdali]KAJ0119012.1 ubiquitin carboxyl-terminal hydrolase 14 [Diaporthe amygdali]
MACPHVDSLSISPPTPAQSVYREDCTQCFDSFDDAEGLNVCLQCFNGGCAGDRQHSALHSALRSHPLVLNVKRTRKAITRDEPPQKITKLAIAAEKEEDKYDTALSVKCLECNTVLDATHPKIAPVVDGILTSNTFSRKEEIKAWEQELTSCEHILLMQQDEPRKIASQDLGGCAKCDLKENLWLCLQCGALGCGRAQFGGVGGHSHALAHSKESGHGVAVKLGSISAEGTADIYCYACDDERVDENLATHLANWGINIAERQKTEKSLTEMQIEQNMKWDFTTTQDGQELKPLYGPGLTGLKNLGNSCYLASVLQCLFDLPAFQKRYFEVNDDLPIVQDPAQDLETQLRKLADGLLSGRYSKPDPDAVAAPGENSTEAHQRGLSPAMFKHLIGRGHEEFSTMRQQDAFELFQHLFKLITRSRHPSPTADPTQPFRFVLEQRLQCLSCKKVRYSTTEQENLTVILPMEKEPHKEGEEGPAPWKPVTFTQCLDDFTVDEVVELTCSSCGSKEGYTKRTLFKTFPEILAVNARRMAIVNWVEVKVDVPVIIPDEPFTLDKYLSQGQQPDEESLPEEAAPAGAPAFVPNETGLAQLEAMGFPRVRAEKALHATGNSDANAAMEWLFAHMEDPDIDTPLDLSATGGGGAAAGPSPEQIEMLTSMGFDVPKAKKALKETGGDMERAVEWLFSHPDDPGSLDDDEGAAAGASVGSDEPSGSATLPAVFQLQSIVCHKGTSIHAGHYVAFIRKQLDKPSWVLFNDEKVVEAVDIEEMRKFGYAYFFKRVQN